MFRKSSLQILTAGSICLSVFSSLSQVSSAASLKLETNKSLRVEYQSKTWNKHTDQVDHAIMLFRDGNTGRLAKIEMQETDINSSLFTGNFQISFEVNGDIVPELYIVPQKLIDSSDSIRKIDQLIKDGTLLRKPFFLRQANSNLQVIEVYDTKEQAIRAYENYRSQRQLVDVAALENQARHKVAAEAAKALNAAKSAELERSRLEAEEKKRLEELKAQQEKLNAEERKKRKLEARKMAAEATKLYTQQNFLAAEPLFAKAAELDPENNSYFFPYGVTLYRLDKYNQSIVELKLATGNEFNPVERDYFIALNHMKLKEFDSASTEFIAIKNKNDKTLSSSAAFFAGVIKFQKEEYDEAKTHFEYTLDNSSDSKLDAQAEAYIEQIANIKMFQLQKSIKFIVGLNYGMQYDSNILNQASSSATQTSLNGIRAAYGGSFEYRPVYSANREFSVVLSASDMYSWDTSFQPKTEFQNYDPAIFDLNFPIKYKGTLWNKPYQMTLTPGFEQMYMNISESKSGLGKREQILGSTILKMDNTFVRSEDDFSSYGIELRDDHSYIDVSSSDEDQSAKKMTISTSQTHFFDKKKTEASIYDGSLAMNMANGKNQKFYRADLGMSYTKPWIKETTLTGRLGLFYTPYPDHSQSRTDNGGSLNINVRKTLNASWAATGNINFTKNNSNIDTDVYDKYIISAGVSYSGAF